MMATALNTPQAVADELLRVDQLRRLRTMAASTEARRLWGPLANRRDCLEAALRYIAMAETFGANVEALTERTVDALRDLEAEIDDTLRQVAIRHRLFVNEDATEDFDEVDVDAILPPAEAARRRWKGR